MRWTLWTARNGGIGRTLVVVPDAAGNEGAFYLQIEPTTGSASPGNFRSHSAPPEAHVQHGQDSASADLQHTAWFDRASLSPEMDLVRRNFSRVGNGVPFLGVVGLVKVRGETWLGLVKDAEPVCNLQDQTVLRVTEVAFFSLASEFFDMVAVRDPDNLDTAPNRDQELRHPCQDIAKYLTNGNFYFSTGLDLTRSLQMQTNEDAAPGVGVDFDHCSNEFLFNRHLLKDLLYVRESLLPDEKDLLDQNGLLLALIQGFVGSHNVRLLNRAGTLCQLALVSRLSCRRAGTRFFTRGIDDDGSVANFVETELILESPRYIFSFVQLRGSVPVFWEQPGVQGFNQRIEFSRGAQAAAPSFRKHFERLTGTYGNVEIINLLSSREPENMLTAAYVEQYERSLGDLREMIDLKNFDFHAECKGGNFDNLGFLYQAIAKFMDSSGYFLYQKETRHPLLLQSGHLRVNCLDCLDRTNVAQTFFALQTVVRHCAEFLDTEGGAFAPEGDAAWRHLWSDNGDALSRIYTGSGAIRSSATRKGKQTLAGLLDDATKSVQRFVVNNFIDKSRQETIDIVLGSGVPEKAFLLRDLVREAVGEKMKAREKEYTQARSFHVHVGTWNVNGKLPGEDLFPWVASGVDVVPEFVVMAFQEIVELTPQQIVVTDINRRRAWEDDILRTLARMTDERYVLLRSIQLVGASLSVFVREDIVSNIRHVETASVKTGLAGLAGNKGGAAIRLVYFDTPICFITAHFAAGQSSVSERNRDYRTITEGIRFRGKSIMEHDIVFFAGDFNYRVDLDYETAVDYLRTSQEGTVLQELLVYDQLRKEWAAGRTFEGFDEGPIGFPPTYKIVNGTANVYENEKGRVPSWCDRILYRSLRPLHLLEYTAAQEIVTSDHKPVKALFQAEAVIIDHQRASRVRKEIAGSLLSDRKTPAAPSAVVEPLINLGEPEMQFKPPPAKNNPFKAANPFVERDVPWWEQGNPVRRSDPALELSSKNPFRQATPSQVPMNPGSWVTFD